MEYKDEAMSSGFTFVKVEECTDSEEPVIVKSEEEELEVRKEEAKCYNETSLDVSPDAYDELNVKVEESDTDPLTTSPLKTEEQEWKVLSEEAACGNDTSPDGHDHQNIQTQEGTKPPDTSMLKNEEEHACPNCGFSYCNKCLKYKAVVPKLGASVHKVCRTCHMNLTKGDDDSDSSKQKEYCPPSSFLRRLESLENPARPPITVYRQDQRIQQLKVGLKEADLEIVDRLEKLREERKQQPLPTEEEVARRLALLRGEDAVKMSTPNKIVPDTRTSQEKADSLLQQYVEQQQLDSKRPKPSDEIAQRLAKLRGHDTSSSSVKNVEEKMLNIEGDTTAAAESEGCSKSELEYNVSGLISQLQKEVKDTSEQMKGLEKDAVECLKSMKMKLSHQKPNQEDESSDEEVEKTIQKALDEVALEEELEEDSETSGKEEELPWCIICNESATVRCIDCDNDLYCKSCFTQGHEEWEMQHHRTVPYTPKEKP